MTKEQEKQSSREQSGRVCQSNSVAGYAMQAKSMANPQQRIRWKSRSYLLERVIEI